MSFERVFKAVQRKEARRAKSEAERVRLEHRNEYQRRYRERVRGGLILKPSVSSKRS